MANDFPTLRRVGKVYPLKGSKNLSKTIVMGRPTVFTTGYLKEGEYAIHIPPGWSVTGAYEDNCSASVRQAVLEGWIPRNITTKRFFGCPSYGVLVKVVPDKIPLAGFRLSGCGWVRHTSSSVFRTEKDTQRATTTGLDVTEYISVLEHNLKQLKEMLCK